MKVLPENVTLRDLRSKLHDEDYFVRGALGVMRAEEKDRGPLQFRLGRTGTGAMPNYRLDSPDGEPLVAYNGDNHTPWPPGEKFDGANNWSTASWSYAELRDHLGEIRNFRR